MNEQRSIALLLQQIGDLHDVLYSAFEGERLALQSRDQWRAAYLQTMREFIELKLSLHSETIEENIRHDELE